MSTYSATHCSVCPKPAACCRTAFAVVGLDPSWPVDATGCCTKLDKTTNRCTIYDDRPRICQIDALRPPSFTLDEWYARNHEACKTMITGETT